MYSAFANRIAVLLFAGNFAGMATGAVFVVYHQSFFGHFDSLLTSSWLLFYFDYPADTGLIGAAAKSGAALIANRHQLVAFVLPGAEVAWGFTVGLRQPPAVTHGDDPGMGCGSDLS